MHAAAATGQPAPTLDDACDAWAASQATLAASGFVRGRKPMSVREVMKLAEVLAATMAEEHRQVLKKQGGLAVAAFVASTEDNRQLMDRAAEAQRQLAAGLHVGVEEILISAIISAQPQGVQPHMQSTKVRIGPNADFIVIESMCALRAASTFRPLFTNAGWEQANGLRLQLQWCRTDVNLLLAPADTLTGWHVSRLQDDVWRFDDGPADTPKRLVMQQMIYDDPAKVSATLRTAAFTSAADNRTCCALLQYVEPRSSQPVDLVHHAAGRSSDCGERSC